MSGGCGCRREGKFWAGRPPNSSFRTSTPLCGHMTGGWISVCCRAQWRDFHKYVNPRPQTLNGPWRRRKCSVAYDATAIFVEWHATRCLRESPNRKRRTSIRTDLAGNCCDNISLVPVLLGVNLCSAGACSPCCPRCFRECTSDLSAWSGVADRCQPARGAKAKITIAGIAYS